MLLQLQDINNLSINYRFVLLKWLKEIDVVPVESTWFGFYGKNGTVLPLEQTDLYKKVRFNLNNY